jgi:type IV pilus assembly protein PilN
MIKINLLPVRATRKKEATQRHLILFGIGLVLVLLVCVAMYATKKKEVSKLQRDNQDLVDEIDNLKLIIPEVEELEKTKVALEKKKEIIGQLRASKMGPVHMLDEIAIRIPEKLWLGSLAQNGQRVGLTGTAINNEVIATFMSNLEQSPYFQDVFLVRITVAKAGEKLKQFEITATTRTPAG